MSTHTLRLTWPAAILAAAVLSAGGAAASDPLPLPEEFVVNAEPASGVLETVETNTRAGGEHADRRPAHSTIAGSAEATATIGKGPQAAAVGPDAEADRHAESPAMDDAAALPASRLLRSLAEWDARTVPGSSSSTNAHPDPAHPGLHAAGMPVGGVLHGCPRALLVSLLRGAAETGDAVSALAIERETLALCRERQEVVNGIVALEGELGTLLAEARAKAEGPVSGTVSVTVADTPIVKESTPVRVVSLPPPSSVVGEAPKEAEAPEDTAPPAYYWFSIIGTAGDLRAGIGDGERGGASVWFVREGDRLPGEVLITGIGTKPPGVRIGGAGEASLPYRPRAIDASIPSSGNADAGGHVAGDGS